MKKKLEYILIPIISLFILFSTVEITLRIFLDERYIMTPSLIELLETDQTLGWKYKKNLDISWYPDGAKEYDHSLARFRTDSEGYRSKNNFNQVSIPDNNSTIFLIGDSTLANRSVSNSKNVESLLAQKLNNSKSKKFKIINQAVEGYNLEQVILSFLITAKYAKRDDIFIIGLCANDHEHLGESYSPLFNKPYLGEDGWVYPKKYENEFRYNGSNWFMYFIQDIYSYQIIRPYLYLAKVRVKNFLKKSNFSNSIPGIYQEGNINNYFKKDITNKLFNLVKESSEKNKFKIYIVPFVDRIEIDSDLMSKFDLQNFQPDALHQFSLNICEKYNFECVSSYEKFSQLEEPKNYYLLPRDPHYNEKGVEILAKSILESLRKGNIYN